MSAEPLEADRGYRAVDQRINIFELVDEDVEKVEENAALVGAWIFADKLQKDEKTGVYSLKEHSFKKLRDIFNPLSDSEQFGEEPVVADSTGFVVGPRLIATAAHCFTVEGTRTIDKIERVQKLRFVLGFQMNDANTFVEEFDQVYEIEEVKYHHFVFDNGSTKSDWALVVLKTEQEFKKFLTLETNPNLNDLDVIDESHAVYSLGYPCGLPLKYTEGYLKDPNYSKHILTAIMDNYRASSGGPLFSKKTHRVIAIFSYMYKENEYIQNPAGEMVRSQIKSDHYTDGYQKIFSLIHLINAINDPAATDGEINDLYTEVKDIQKSYQEIVQGMIDLSKECSKKMSDNSRESSREVFNCQIS